MIDPFLWAVVQVWICTSIVWEFFPKTNHPSMLVCFLIFAILFVVRNKVSQCSFNTHFVVNYLFIEYIKVILVSLWIIFLSSFFYQTFFFLPSVFKSPVEVQLFPYDKFFKGELLDPKVLWYIKDFGILLKCFLY